MGVLNGEYCQVNFQEMVFAKKTIGQADIPIKIWRANMIKEKIDARKMIGMVEGNASDLKVSGDSDIIIKILLLDSDRLVQGDVEEVRRPATNKERGVYKV